MSFGSFVMYFLLLLVFILPPTDTNMCSPSSNNKDEVGLFMFMFKKDEVGMFMFMFVCACVH